MLADFPFLDSYSGATVVTAPTSGANFSSPFTPEAGIYKIIFSWCLTGTTETTLNNVRLKANNLNIITTLPSITSAGWMTGILDRVTLDGTHAVSLAAGSSATAGAVYSGLVTATRIG